MCSKKLVHSLISDMRQNLFELTRATHNMENDVLLFGDYGIVSSRMLNAFSSYTNNIRTMLSYFIAFFDDSFRAELSPDELRLPDENGMIHEFRVENGDIVEDDNMKSIEEAGF